MNSMYLLRVIPVFAALLLVSACERVDTFNLRVSVYVKDGGTSQVFSEVVAFQVRHREKMFTDFDGAQMYFTRTGEAVVIETGKTIYLASYLGGRVSASSALAASIPGLEINDEWWARISDITDEHTVPPEHWPVFFAVPAEGVAEDIRILDRTELAKLGVTRVTLQPTTDPPELGTLAAALPWANAVSDGVLCQDELLAPVENRPDCSRIQWAELLEHGVDE